MVPGLDAVAEALDSLGILDIELRHIVVFSGGPVIPDEQVRFEEAYGDLWGPSIEWVNLHKELRACYQIRSAIRKHRYVWRTGRKKGDYSLEALEYEFGISRPDQLRSASKTYRGGDTGSLSPLEHTKQWIDQTISEDDLTRLQRYTRYDVESMFRIARECELLLFSQHERGARHRDFT